MRLNQYFTRREMACQCGCGFDTCDVGLLAMLTDIREYFDAPVIINSACRCAEHNKEVGGSENSQHLYGKACDIVVANVPEESVYFYLDDKYPNSKGIGLYRGRTHIDSRDKRARWSVV